MDIRKIKSEFNRIKKMGYIKSRRIHNTGIGKTFEDYLGVTENNLRDSDFKGFEVKSHRVMAQSKITLFTKSPSFPPKANHYLRIKYGKPDLEFPDFKVLHTSFFGDRFNNYLNTYVFKMKINKKAEKVNILIKDFKTKKTINDEIYYSFADIEKATKKLKNLFIVYADNKYIEGDEYFHYTNAEVYLDFNLDQFYQALEKGYIQYDVRIGVYKSGKNYGKTHDHGSGFRLGKNHLKDIYNEYMKL